MNWSLLSVEISLALFALGLLIYGMLTPSTERRHVGPVTGFFLVGLLVWTYSKFQVNDVFMGNYIIDPMATFVKMGLLIAAILVVFASNDWIMSRGKYQVEFYTLIIMATLGMVVMASAGDFITAYMGVEVMTISFIILAAFKKGDKLSAESGMKYFVLGSMASVILLYGLTLVFGATQTIVISEVGAALAEGMQPIAILGIILVVVAFAFKGAVVPFHMWAPDVHSGAPSPVTALLTSSSIKIAAFVVMLRFFLIGFQPAWEVWSVLLIVLSIATLVVGNLIALAQTNVKRMLAYSSVSHGGYVLLGVISNSEIGVTAVLVYSMIYIFANAGAFLVVTAVESATGGKEMKDFSGLMARSPILAVSMLVFLASLAALPPTAGFIAKFWVFYAAIDQGLIYMVVIALAMSVVSIYYYLRVIKVMFMGEPESDQPITISTSMKSVFITCVIVTLFLGVYPTPVIELAAQAARAFMPF